jgi:ubiquitin-conjugating enzyme E2 M
MSLLRQDPRRRRLPPHSYESKRVWLSLGTCERSQKLAGAWLTGCSLDLSELSLGSTMKTYFPNPDDILNFTLTIEPDEGMYKGGRFNFSFAINQNFPHDPPKVKCTQKIYHPNIDLEGNVCLNILREDWKPVLNLNAVIVGLQVGYSGRKQMDKNRTADRT